jgi:hypothetical protein
MRVSAELLRPRTREGAATLALGASSVAPVASGYERSLRPSERGVSRLACTMPKELDR